MRTLFSRLRSRVVRFRSVREALADLLSASQFERLLLSTPDRRELVRSAACLLETSEEELTLEIGRRLKLPVAPRIQPLNLEELPFMDVAELKAAGAIPLMRSGRIWCIVCIDPELAALLVRAAGPVEVALGTWSQILYALQESEARQLEQRVHVEAADRSKRDQLARSVLGIVCEEAHTHGASRLVLKKEKAELAYYFRPLAAANDARGVIHRSIAAPLWSLVRDAPGTLSIPQSEGAPPFKASTQREGADACVISLHHHCPTAIVPSSTSSSNVGETAPPQPRPLEHERIVMLIEDNISFAKVVERFFARNKVQVRHFNQAELALEALGKLEVIPELILCDLHLPGINGKEVVTRLRKHESLGDLPVVILTSDEETETEISLLDSGADAFLRKSGDPRVLFAHVNRLLEKRRAASKSS